MVWIESTDLELSNNNNNNNSESENEDDTNASNHTSYEVAWQKLKECDGILVPGTITFNSFDIRKLFINDFLTKVDLVSAEPREL